MKALHVIPSLAKADGGPAHAVLLMAKALERCGITVDVATTDDAGHGRRLAVLPCEPQRYYFPRRLAFYKVAPAFVGWITRRVRDYDVVHIHALFSFVSVVAALVAAVAGVPYILRPLGTLNQYGVRNRRSWLKRMSLRCIEGPLLRRAAAVHFTSEAEQHEAAQLGIPLRAVVVPLGIEPFVAPSPAVLAVAFPALKSRRLVLFLSRLDRKKNIEALLQAYAQCRHEFADLCLVLAGSGDAVYVASLQALTAELGVQDGVVWPGFVAGEQKAALLAAADVFVLPSFSENFGIAAAEALMAGLPCILGRGVALAGDVEAAGAGIGVQPDADSIANALRSVLADADLRHHMQRAARKLAAAHYSLDAMGTALAVLYRRIQVPAGAG